MVPHEWRVAGKSVRGASHCRRGAPNQDAILWLPDRGPSVVLAVADGHGSSSSFRSATGSLLAVKVAVALLREIPEHSDNGTPCPSLDAEALARELIGRWRAEVASDRAANPLPAGVERGPETPAWNVYGSTVLAVLATDRYLVCLQLGDGDILIVSSSGKVTRPFPRDPRCLGVETTSLCGAAAWADTRVLVAPLTAESPALVLVSTDGYANSFREDAGFLRTGADILDMIRQDGFEKVEGSLEGWLNEASLCGSGDDITMGIVYRSAVAPHGPEAGGSTDPEGADGD